MSEDAKYIQFMNETLNSYDVQHIGHVYVLGSSLGYYKIGLTTNLFNRFSNFGVKLPFDVWLENAKIYYDCAWGERYWHFKFAEKRVNGEWFKLNEFDLDNFHYTLGDTATDAKLTCLYGNSKPPFWESDFAKSILENYNWKIAYRKAAIQDYLDLHLTRPEITRQYIVRKNAKYNALISDSKNLNVNPGKESL